MGNILIEKRRYKLLIADQHNLVREAIADFLRREDDFDVSSIGYFNDVFNSLREDTPTDMLLLDISMPGMDGIASISQLAKQHPDVKLVVFSGGVSNDVILKSIQAGAQGYVPKTLPLCSLVSALKLVLSGQVFLPMSVLTDVDGRSSLEGRSENPKVLTSKEVSIIKLVSDGKTNKEIAWELSSSEITVKMYLRTIFNKLGASNRTHAVMLAQAKSLL